MKRALSNIKKILNSYKLVFIEKPIIIGAMALYYYGIKEYKGPLELIVNHQDFNRINESFKDKKEDIWGDFVIILGDLLIWRSYSLFDYLFFKADAIEEELCYLLSIDRLMFSKVLKINSKKHFNDLLSIRDYFYEKYRNDEYVMYALSRYSLYINNSYIGDSDRDYSDIGKTDIGKTDIGKSDIGVSDAGNSNDNV